MQPIRKRSTKTITGSRRLRRRGSLIVWCALLLVVLIGMLGLVVDGGLLMAAHRHVQNAADAAALSDVSDRLSGVPGRLAQSRARRIVTHVQHNNLPGATVTLNTPPSTGPYVGNQDFTEAIVSTPLPTYFIHVLPGVSTTVSVTARAVAGFEWVSPEEVILALNPDARPGVSLADNARLRVTGVVHVNSEGGGVDENGNQANENDGLALNVGGGATLYAEEVFAVGGVNDPEGFQDIDGGSANPLDADMHPITDPFQFLPTPLIYNGVVDVDRGEPLASREELSLNNPRDNSANPNFIERAGQPNETMVLHPGIYTSIQIRGGRVRFEPGIYVLKPGPDTRDTLVITSGTVIAQGIMFYNTGSDYQPVNGIPDIFDDDVPPPSVSSTNFGRITIDAGLGFTGINSSVHAYDPPVTDAFDGMLIYQRRWNEAPLRLEGNSDSDEVVGTVYAKWAGLTIAGQGIYDTQLVVGSLALPAGGNITIQHDGNLTPKAPHVYLTE